MLRKSTVLVFCLAVPMFSQALAQCPDRDALLAFYNALRVGGPWMHNGSPLDWDTSQMNCCNTNYYPGVTCDPGGNVTVIDLDGDFNGSFSFINGCDVPPDLVINLSGQLPNPFVFPNLQTLTLSKANISGTLPDFSGSPRITGLFINCNNLSGQLTLTNIPAQLQRLSLEDNEISGPFPNLNSRPFLVSINLARNNLEGNIPNLSLPNLQHLLLNENNLSGIIPGFAGQPLRELDLQLNRFTFKDMLPNYALLQRPNLILKIGSQQPVSPPQTVTLAVGGDWVWNLGVDDTVTTSTYTWHGPDTIIVTNINTLRKEVTPQDAGQWMCRITNAVVKDVVLESGPMQVSVCMPDRLDIDTALCPGQTLEVRGMVFDRSNPSGKIQVAGAAANGCDSLYVVNLQFPALLAAAPDTVVCDDNVLLRAVLPIGYQGQWLALDGGSIGQPTKPETMASNLEEGDNRFVWVTFSSECPDGDTDTARVFFDRPPEAFSDAFEMFLGQQLNGNFWGNDIFDPLFDNTDVLIPPPGGKFLHDADGNFMFSPEPTFSGTYKVQYRICSPNCPLSYCDTALIAIRVVQERQQNVVTPNGDGLNDYFVVAELTADQEELPNNRLVIWSDTGEILLERSPYRNDWPPQNKLLPKVYYYSFFRDNEDVKGRSGFILIQY